MNILFVLHSECCPLVGGIERVTDILVDNFGRLYGHQSFCVYTKKIHPDERQTTFSKSYYMPCLSAEQLAVVIKECEIDCIINQEEHFISKTICDGVKLSGRRCRIIYCLHSLPLALARMAISFKSLIKNWKYSHSLSDLAKIAFYPIYRYFNLEKAKNYYRDAALFSQYNVLLSDAYRAEWERIVRCRNLRIGTLAKVTSIPNPSTFNYYASESDILHKEKRVLMVCRLNEPKNVIEALRIWREIEKDGRVDDWCLDIVGDGVDRKRLVSYAAKHRLRVTFYGLKDPWVFYRRSSVFLMTSFTEGWPMTLVECQQAGCVPVCYDTFGSLRDVMPESLHDCIIQPWNRNAYVMRLKNLMVDVGRRVFLAQSAVDAVKSFNSENICKKWMELFEEK